MNSSLNTTVVKGRLYELADDTANRNRQTFSYQGRSSSRDAMSWEPLRRKQLKRTRALTILLSGAFFGAALFLVIYLVMF